MAQGAQSDIIGGAVSTAGLGFGFAGASKKRRAARKRRAALFRLAQRIGQVPISTIRAGDRELRFGEADFDVSDFLIGEEGTRELEQSQLDLVRQRAAPQRQRERAQALGTTIDQGTTGLRTGNLFTNPVLQAQAAQEQLGDLDFQLAARELGFRERTNLQREFGILFGAEMARRNARFQRQLEAASIELGGIRAPRGSEIQADFLLGAGAGLFNQGTQIIGGGGSGGGGGANFGGGFNFGQGMQDFGGFGGGMGGMT